MNSTANLSRRDFSLALGATAFAAALPVPALATGPDADFVYVSNRGENTLVSYSVNPPTGELAFAQRLPSGGDPWSFTIHPPGAGCWSRTNTRIKCKSSPSIPGRAS